MNRINNLFSRCRMWFTKPSNHRRLDELEEAMDEVLGRLDELKGTSENIDQLKMDLEHEINDIRNEIFG